MYLAFFALLTVVGAAIAWRSSPLYSLGKTVRFLAVFALTVAAEVASIATVVNVTMHAPTIVFALSLAATITVGTIGFILVIMAMTTPHAPKLAPGTVAVTLHRDRVRGWARNWLIALAVFGGLGLVLPGDWKIVPLELGGLTLYLGIVMLFVGYVSARTMDYSLTAIEADAWIHWKYTPEQWRAWTDVEVARLVATPPWWVWRRDWKRLIVPVVAVVAGISFLDPGNWEFKTAYLVGLLALSAIVVSLSNWYGSGAPRRLRRTLTTGAPDTYFASAGLFADGTFLYWQTYAKYLVEATIDERAPRNIVFRYTEIVSGAPGTVTKLFNVLIPPGADADLARLQQVLSATVPTANIALSAETAGDVPAVTA